MFWNKPTVLMLGWEYPPNINGGLGIACHGLAQALADYVNITMIVPKSGLSTKSHLRIEGLDNYKDSIEEPIVSNFLETIPVNIALNPYTQTRSKNKIHFPDELPTVGKSRRTNFATAELYGGDLYLKVKDYAHLVTRCAAQKSYELIHAHDWMTFPAAIALKKITGKPLVIHIHASEYDRMGTDSKGWVYQIEKAAMEAAEAIITVSNYSAKILATHYEIDPSKIFTVHNAIIPLQTHPPKNKQFSEKLVTYLGRITQQKNPEAFLAIAIKVLEQYDNVRFVMAGKGDMLSLLMEKVAQEKLGHKFHFTGFLDTDAVKNLLAITDIYVMPSISDPFGLSALEAAQLGIPCVISRQSGVLEVLKGVLTADCKDTDLMAEYIVTLLKYPELAAEIGTTCRDSISSLTWDTSALKVIEIYSNLLRN